MNNSKMPQIGDKQELINQLEIENLRERIKILKSTLKENKESINEEIIKKEIKDYLQELQQNVSEAPPLAIRDEAEEISKFPVAQQIGALISLVFDKGLQSAISVARILDNPAILDEFHDILVDRYYDELIRRKIIKEL